jgi:hypothetical protein
MGEIPRKGVCIWLPVNLLEFLFNFPILSVGSPPLNDSACSLSSVLIKGKTF